MIWTATLAGMSLLYCYVVLRAMRRARDLQLAFVVFALGVRYLLSAFPETTTTPVVAGQSMIALSSLAVCAIGLLVVEKRLLRLRVLLPLYIFLFLLVMSGVVNGTPGGMAAALTRFVYLIVIMLALASALDRQGMARVFSIILPVFALPVGLQWASLLLGLDKRALAGAVQTEVAEIDAQAINFIGPYGHESGFSMVLLAMLFCLAFWRARSDAAFWCLVVIAVAGVLLANYRTTMVAVVPILLAIMATRLGRHFRGQQRSFAMLVTLCIVSIAGAGALATSDLASRFAEIADIELASFSRNPTHLTAADRAILSGRIYIWTQYLSAFNAADFAQQLIGFGPEGWRGNFRLYAHNTFVSFLYEYGYLGLGAFLVFWISYFVMAFSIRDRELRLVIVAAYLGFTTINLATMPIWQLEGLIFFALLNGVLLHAIGGAGRQAEAIGARGARAAAAAGSPRIVLDTGRQGRPHGPSF